MFSVLFRRVVKTLVFCHQMSMDELKQQFARYKQYSISVDNMIFAFVAEDSSTVQQDPALLNHDHQHPFLEIFVCRQEKMELYSRNKGFWLYRGDVAIVPPLVPHHCPTEQDPNAREGAFLMFYKDASREGNDLYSEFEPYISLRNVLIFRNEPEFLEGISSVSRLREDRSFSEVLNLVYLFSRLSEKYQLSKEKPLMEALVPVDASVLLCRLDFIMNTEYMQRLTVKDIAKRLHISSRQLERIVEKTYKTTLYRAITEIRLTSAAKLLLASDLSAEQIAVKVGYGSKSAFYKAFLRQYGVTPLQFRRSAEEESL